jgi:hypothetical protein
MSNVGWQELAVKAVSNSGFIGDIAVAAISNNDWAEDVTVAEMSKEQGARSKEQGKIAILWEL